jgi:tetratricopeptide (TPR) repeat protein
MTSKFREASLLLKSWISNNSKQFGPDHLETLVAKGYQAACLGKLGKDTEAATLFRDILSSLERNKDTDLSHQFKATFSLAEILLKMDSYAEAEGVFESLIEMGHELFEANDPGTLLNAKTLASLKYRLEKRNEAEALYKWVLSGYEAIFGYNHIQTLIVLIIYADLLFEVYKINKPPGAEKSAREVEGIDLGAVGQLYERILLIQQEMHGAMSEQTLTSTLVIGIYMYVNRYIYIYV